MSGSSGPTTVTDVPGHGTITTNSSGFGSADQNKAQDKPSKTPLVQRAIDVIIKLGKGDYGQSGEDLVTLRGLRVTASVQKFGAASMNSAQIRIAGMDHALMDKISTLGLPNAPDTRRNAITIIAISGQKKSTVFEGIIWEAYTSFEAMPEVEFNIQSTTGLVDQLKPIDPASYPGAVDAVVVMQGFAKTMGVAFENGGVPPTMLHESYFPGTVLQQVEACAEAANIAYTLDDNKLVIVPMFGGYVQGDIPLISAETGMIGYPAFAHTAYMRVAMVYNPQVRFLGRVRIESKLRRANGVWRVTSVQHDLASENPFGSWFTTIEVDKLGVTTA